MRTCDGVCVCVCVAMRRLFPCVFFPHKLWDIYLSTFINYGALDICATINYALVYVCIWWFVCVRIFSYLCGRNLCAQLYWNNMYMVNIYMHIYVCIYANTLYFERKMCFSRGKLFLFSDFDRLSNCLSYFICPFQ